MSLVYDIRSDIRSTMYIDIAASAFLFLIQKFRFRMMAPMPSLMSASHHPDVSSPSPDPPERRLINDVP